MNKKYIGIIALSTLFLAYIFHRNYAFIPTAQDCGAAINPRGRLVDDFERGIKCMLAGHKDVYLGNIAGVIYERIPKQYESKEIQLIRLPEGGFILYTKKGERNARLLEKLDSENINIRRNDFLAGYLLGYAEEDIKYFYDQNKISTFEQDKTNAMKWIASNTK